MRSLNTGSKVSLALTTFAVLGCITSLPATAASFYKVTDLGVGIAQDINDLTQVVGGLGRYQTDPLRAFVWSENTGTIELGTFGGNYSFANGINNLGQVVGYASGSNGDTFSFLWSESTGLINIGTLGNWPYPVPQENTANSINDLGQVVGSSNREAFFWSQNEGFTSIPTIRNGFEIANDINNLGQVVGSAGTPGGGIRAFIWSQSSGPIDPGSFGGYYTGASGINDLGEVVGASRAYVPINDLVAELGRAFLWTENTGLTNLGTLGDPWSESFAYEINNSGQVVGSLPIVGSNFDSSRAFIWEDGVMADLNNLIPDNPGWQLLVANSINNKGQIVGYGLFNRATHAFLLTPVSSYEPKPIPETSSGLGVLAFGVWGAGSLWKRRRPINEINATNKE